MSKIRDPPRQIIDLKNRLKVDYKVDNPSLRYPSNETRKAHRNEMPTVMWRD